jgi:hypothetical protein
LCRADHAFRIHGGIGHLPDAISITGSTTEVPTEYATALSCTHRSGRSLCVARKPCAIVSAADTSTDLQARIVARCELHHA